MPKLPSIEPVVIEKALIEKGFVLARTKGSHRVYINRVTGKRVIIPFHKKELPKGTLMSILKQAGIDRNEFLDLI